MQDISNIAIDVALWVHITVVIGALVAAMVSFAVERVSIEVTSVALLVGLLVWFQIAPLTAPGGGNLLGPETLLAGFANPSLISVLALLVMGQAMVQTGALSQLSRMFVRLSRRHRVLSLGSCFAGVLLTSAILNNTPVVVMFIPIMQSLALRFGWSPSSLMMPLSFAAILGGMTTLIGSSTNLLVASALSEVSDISIGLFDFFAIGVVLAAVGSIYVGVVLPRILPHRASLAGQLRTEGRQFIAEIDVSRGSDLIGAEAKAGQFKALPDITVRQIIRRGQTILPPFDGVQLEAGDAIIVAATRTALTDALTKVGGHMLTDIGRAEGHAELGEDRRPETGPGRSDRVLAEVMVAPASRMRDQTIDMVGFQQRFGCLVLGIQRRGRMARLQMRDIRLEPGDVLLVTGKREDVDALSSNPDLLLMTWAIRDMPVLDRSRHATAIFLSAVGLAAIGVLPITVAAAGGAFAMIAAGCLNLRQAVRAIDRTIVLLVGSTLALGAAMQETGAAQLIADTAVHLLPTTEPLWPMAMLFLVIALCTNIMSNNACAIIFTPIAISFGADLGVSPLAAAITVILAANCSFATPIGYQTNLLVMGPGRSRFRDYLIGGLPLVFLMWITYIIVAPGYFGF